MTDIFPPRVLDLLHRVHMTTHCRDADAIPKVPDAGSVCVEADGTRTQIMHNGLKVSADGYYGAWMTDLIRLCRGHHEPQEERVFHELVSRLGPSATMVELGGYWAYYSLWFLQHQPHRRAYVLEPDPAHLAVGRANAKLNKLYPTFVAGFAGAKASPAVPFKTEDSGELTLRCWSVNELVDHFEVGTIDILHCDVQGAELSVIESCLPLFYSGRINWIFVSTHAQQITGDPLTHQRCLALLEQAEAAIEVEHDVHESFSGDGLIVARWGPAPSGWQSPKLSYNRYSHSLFRNPIYDLAEALRCLDVRPKAMRAEQASSLARGIRKLKSFWRTSCAHLDPQTAQKAPTTDREIFLRKISDQRYIVERPCALGDLGDRLAIPADTVMLPELERWGSWDNEGLRSVTNYIGGLERPFIVLDIGANVGLFTRQLLRRVPEGIKAFCVEPDRENFAALSYNLQPFLPDKVELFNLALGAIDGTADFYRDRGNFGNYSLNLDAMRHRTFEQTVAKVVSTERWMHEALPPMLPIVWKSDTQGCDEAIIASTPGQIWSRVRFAKIELWRIRKPAFDVEKFRERIDAFPYKAIGGRSVTTAEIIEYLSGTDWQHADLYAWQ